MKDFVSKLKQDLTRLQETLELEGNDLVKRVRTAATKQNLLAKTKEIESLLEKNFKKFEPTLNEYLKGVKKSAAKYGIDITPLEAKIHSAAKAMRSKARTSAKAGTNGKKTGAAAPKRAAKKKTSSTAATAAH